MIPRLTLSRLTFISSVSYINIHFIPHTGQISVHFKNLLVLCCLGQFYFYESRNKHKHTVWETTAFLNILADGMYSCYWTLNSKFFITRNGSIRSANAWTIRCSRCRMWIRLTLHKVRVVGPWQQERRRRAAVQCSVSLRRDSGQAGTGVGRIYYKRGITMLSRSVIGSGDKSSTPFRLCVTCCIYQVSFRNSGHWVLPEEVGSD
jgi:hypothetical protein